MHIAHIRKGADGDIYVQTAAEHSRNAARYASACLECISLSQAAYLAALLHDMGKFTEEFRSYLEAAVEGKDVRKGSVIHTHTAVRYLLERRHKACFESFQDMTAELLAYAAAAHHGLFDCVNEAHELGLEHRKHFDEGRYREGVTHFLSECAGEAELDALFEAADRELQVYYQWVNQQQNDAGKETFFHLGLLSRLLLSAVVEGDRRDTRFFMNARKTWTAELSATETVCWLKWLANVELLLGNKPGGGAVHRARQVISEQCAEAALREGGIYRLNVPTGAGKTLSSLRYALRHAAEFNKSRIIFTAPLLSVLEQNAAVIREAVGDEEAVLEHHSNVVQENLSQDELGRYELLCECWEAPIIVTTLVQLLYTCFGGKMSAVCRFHALCNAVLIIDEVQTVPLNMLSLFNLCINFLAGICKTTVVLCSATQPCLEAVNHPITGPMVDMVPVNEQLWTAFRRSRLKDAGKYRLREIPDFIHKKMRNCGSLLLICNTKIQAQYVYECLRQLESTAVCFHFSAAMCPQHRRDVLAELYSTLEKQRKGGRKVICISTQVMEAGVDISFEQVVRLLAGMDNAVQSAGRANRNGELAKPADVWLLNCEDEDLKHMPDMLRAKTASEKLLYEFRQEPALFEGSLDSDTAIRRYYHFLYEASGEGKAVRSRECPPGIGDYILQETQLSLYDLLSVNQKYTLGQPGMERYGLHQAFAQAGERFRVFDEESISVLVPYGAGRELIREIEKSEASLNLKVRSELLKKARAYTISLFSYQKERLSAQGGLICLMDGAVLALGEQYYDELLGLKEDIMIRRETHA